MDRFTIHGKSVKLAKSSSVICCITILTWIARLVCYIDVSEESTA
jgi:hypothetical protein